MYTWTNLESKIFATMTSFSRYCLYKIANNSGKEKKTESEDGHKVEFVVLVIILEKKELWIVHIGSLKELKKIIINFKISICNN